MAIDSSCLATTYRNTSGQTMVFSFLPPHGLELTAGEEVAVLGNPTEHINRGDRFGSRWNEALLAALEADTLEIVSTPMQVCYDETLAVSQTLGVDNGSLSMSSVCWETSLSS